MLRWKIVQLAGLTRRYTLQSSEDLTVGWQVVSGGENIVGENQTVAVPLPVGILRHL